MFLPIGPPGAANVALGQVSGPGVAVTVGRVPGPIVGRLASASECRLALGERAVKDDWPFGMVQGRPAFDDAIGFHWL